MCESEGREHGYERKASKAVKETAGHLCTTGVRAGWYQRAVGCALLSRVSCHIFADLLPHCCSYLGLRGHRFHVSGHFLECLCLWSACSCLGGFPKMASSL